MCVCVWCCFREPQDEVVPYPILLKALTIEAHHPHYHHQCFVSGLFIVRCQTACFNPLLSKTTLPSHLLESVRPFHHLLPFAYSRPMTLNLEEDIPPPLTPTLINWCFVCDGTSSILTFSSFGYVFSLTSS